VLSERTVERHIANLYSRLGARGRVEAARHAVRLRLV
jgi:DNA-binding NarL/FixJ family response regulator